MNNDVDSGGASTAVVEETLPKLADMSEQDRSAYLKDGTLPKTEQKPTSDDGAKPVESGAASDAANKDQGQDKDEEPKRESRAERRIRKLNDEIKQLRAEKAKAETKPPIESRPVADAAKPAAGSR